MERYVRQKASVCCAGTSACSLQTFVPEGMGMVGLVPLAAIRQKKLIDTQGRRNGGK